MKALSLFSGVGLHDLGLERAGWEIAGQAEIDPWCREVLAKHWPSVQRWEDVRDVTAESLSGLGRIELVTGGFPCPDLSSAGRGVGLLRGKRSSLWFEMLRIIELVLPAFVLAENVPALFSRGIDTVLAGLEEAGYAAWPVVVGAWAVGAPHRRDRVWIVGCRVAGTEGERLEGWEEGQRSAPRSAAWRGVSKCRVGDPNPSRREGAGAEAHEGRERSRNGRSGRMADPNSGALRLESGRIGGEGWAGAPEPGDAGEGVAHAHGYESSADRGEPVPGPDRGHDSARCSEGGIRSSRWPARRGEPQHSWEPPRLVESRVGRDVNVRAARLDGFARRNRLKALGNANPWQAPYLIGRWMLENAATPEPD